ncbi:uncharacterized protein LOC115661072 [Gopherus evgoodei]|uniref:uncharacterized protein LOC115661072 n=1 Tax=Gopherus evgoodei TaxID=1825980 RepID=UPI0011CFE678|nr:uncharacterized protein LOC115661072 [Gopherus evgoodei]
MAWAPLLLTLLTYCSGSSSQPVLTQPPSISVSPGENVRLACTMPSGYSNPSYRVQWLQQKPGSAPRFVYHYQASNSQGRGTGIPARFTVSPDTSNNLWNLVISGVQAEDEADYYCATWDGRSKTHHSDTNTNVKVSGTPGWFSGSSSGNTAYLTISGALAEDDADYYCLTHYYQGGAFKATQFQFPAAPVTEGVRVSVSWRDRDPSCSLSSGALADHNHPFWVQQRLGNVPRLIMHSTSTRPSGIPERFIGSRSGNTMSLTITGTLAEDDADYYCSRESDGSWKRDVILWILTMAWAPLLLTLLTYCIDFSSQQLQSLKASELVSPGGTVTLSCSLSSGALTDHNHPFWVQQRLGNVPRLIMHSTSTRPSGIPERFTGSRSGNTMSLTITGTIAEDDADYYCSVWTGSARHSSTIR